MSEKKRVLIENWLPVTELGIESQRERGAASALPPLSFLHVWWARRPLVASAAVVLTGLLPSWTPELGASFAEHSEIEDENSYRRWVLRMVGIWGDPIAGKKLIEAANATGSRLVGNGYGYKQAFRNPVSSEDIDLLHKVLIRTWGSLPLVADPTAGGGSIPFTAARLGLPVFANDLNGVAASVLKAGVEITARNGSSLTPKLKKWGLVLVERVERELKPFFPLHPGENVIAYIWANAVASPRTGNLIPLLTNKWLRKGSEKEVAVRLVTEIDGAILAVPQFELLFARHVDVADASSGTLVRGDGISPYDNLIVDGDYIKAEAQAGRMTQILYAVSIRNSRGERTFRSPDSRDLDAISKAEERFLQVKEAWLQDGILPNEFFPDGNDMRPKNYGMVTWLDFFTPRQALVHGTFGAEFEKLIPEIRANEGSLADDILFELALIQGKALNYNSRLGSWDVSKQGMRSVFERHDFAFKWTFAEFEGARALYTWCLSQLTDAYSGISKLFDETGSHSLKGNVSRLERQVTVTQGGAANLLALADGSVAHLCMDPPYYDNVMYAELADFFYVWEKRTLGRLRPEFFSDDLSDKQNEAVANPARFANMGKRKKELADLDYESKMTAIFKECKRVLRDDGVMSVMFTHKRAEAWDTLGMGLLKAGFTIETSWPVNTEAKASLHQANMNSAASTIMLVCRKRPEGNGDKVFIDDIEAEVRQLARDSVIRFREDGIEGVDLLLSTYGPALSVVSKNWPVYSMAADDDGKARLLRPDEALAIARQEVVRLQRSRIIGREAQIDNHSDFVLIAWETFKAPEFPFDEARRLALAVGGLDIDALSRAKVLEKKSGSVRLLSPLERIRRGDEETGVRPDAGSFQYMNDALDTALYIAELDGMQQAKSFLERIGLLANQNFQAFVQGMANTVPRIQIDGSWVFPIAGQIDVLATAYMPDISLPEVPVLEVETPGAPTLFDGLG